ncbi:SGNH/GDSL hydrolase family protein [Pontibacter chitinilyticus]|uniref:SGNH/GDSL hydrolase family protein n=1 Tax=Pontibacter chitinilyticus TaxID=2674989 RepID=UPI00321BC5FA
MKDNRSCLSYLLLLMLITSCKVASPESAETTSSFIDFKNDQIAYTGRIGLQRQDAGALYWSGTTISINVEGTSVAAVLQDETGNNYFNILVDGDTARLLRPGTTKQAYTLATGLSAGKHTITLFKRTEYDRGTTLFYGFELSKNTRLLPPPAPKKRKLEFYGNSITAGYAVEDYSGKDQSDSTYTNNYLSYAAITARHFDAAYTCICKSGIGIMVSWFPYTMPEIYDRLNPSEPDSKWDFTKYKPDVVVINLLQNDSWIVTKPENDQFKRVFGTTPPSKEFILNAYSTFVQSVREKYPDAQIICMLGNMDITQPGSPWPGYVQEAVATLKDDKIYTLAVPYKNTPGHPSIAEQQQLADALIHLIEQKVNW